MNYVKVGNENNVIEYPYLLSRLVQDYPNTSFPSEITDDFLATVGLFKVQHDDVNASISPNQYVKDLEPVLEEGLWKVYYEVLEKTEEHIALELQARSRIIRKERNKLLLESDWVVAKAYELGTEVPQEWKEYRQALRDIPSQEGFPFVVVFPQLPTV